MDRKIKVRVGADMARRRVLAALAALAATPLVRPPSARAAAAFASEIAPGVYVHQGHHALFSPENGGDISNAGFIVGHEAVAVVDTGGSAHVGAALRAAIRAVTDLPIRYVINTHMHPDHVFGNAAFADDAPAFVGHAKLARGLAARSERYLAINKELMGEAAFAGTRIILPTVVVEDRMTIDLGGRTIELEAEKTAHTDNDVIVRDTATGTVFLGDLLFSEHVPTLDGSIRGWLALMERLTAVPAQRVVPGHGPPSMPWPDAAKPLQRYLNTVATDVRRLIKENRTLSEATETAGLSEKDAWLLFEDYHKRNVSAAFAELEWE
jgi:quinoprotein relay system zinc metallohydrolase 2